MRSHLDRISISLIQTVLRKLTERLASKFLAVVSRKAATANESIRAARKGRRKRPLSAASFRFAIPTSSSVPRHSCAGSITGEGLALSFRQAEREGIVRTSTQSQHSL